MNTTTRTPHTGDVFYHGWGFKANHNPSLPHIRRVLQSNHNIVNMSR